MKSFIRSLLASFIAIACVVPVHAQSFVQELNEDDFSALLGNGCTVKLQDGSTLRGKLVAGNLMNGYLTKTTFKLDDGENRKLRADEVLRLSVKANTLVKLAMLSEASSSVKEFSKTDRQKVLRRDSVIFERALKPTENDKYALMQLLNPGFDNKLQVFIDPQARRTTEFGLNDVTLTGGENRVYLFVKKEHKAFRVKKNSYRQHFDDIFGDCPMLLAEWPTEQAAWKDVAAHVYFYDIVCD